MKALNDIEKILKRLLVEKAKILDSWRNQDLNTGNRVKNFENWLLVELVHDIKCKNLARQIKTNGRVKNPSYPPPDVRKQLELKGRKRNSEKLSPDLSIKIKPYTGWIDVEIKTQTSRQEVIDDAKIVKFHNRNEKNPNYRAAFLWVVVEPKDQKFAKRVRRSAKEIVKSADEEGLKLERKEIKNAPWLYYYFTAL